MCKVLLAVECPFLDFNGVQGGFEGLQGEVAQGRQRNRGFSRAKIRGVSMPRCPLQSIPFLFRTP
jgi:hypothetical protein